ncbi:metallophosphoesterase [Pyrococcus furiosus DSM 3638]|uniref:Phosphoesterase n=3 Tax=Pyrococcus furiosus TaxID=2261 RepID=Q8U028_PYRFU|nr:metallophosphoesterase [Pyrococcus furiosus]AAL81916.1 5'-cyclic-nucleotide phosphodiesterase cpda homolog [Pyrococcus furiosus DSM 3638]AFN04849.1 5'-cyclic-nucleotide phosphodiesterase [Pyrococcus furiosus COM1]QEK79394.1 metallophosphoesterase [Pyrococcus furiosus DSM 3638]
MKVGVLSDTHIPKAYFPPQIFEFLKKRNVQYIIHAGDITSKEFLEKLEEVAPVIAVKGNMDRIDLPEEEKIEIGNFSILILHGHQFLSLNLDNLTYKALEEEVDILVFGHTHRPYYNVVRSYGREIILLNPGSPTLPRMSEPTFAILEVSNEDIDVHFYNVFSL